MRRLLAVGALLPLLAAAPATADVTVTTQNVRQGLTPAQARHDITHAAAHSTVVVTQEMGLRHARAFAPAGWGTAHAAGIRRGDCATYWDARVWRVEAWWTRELTYASFKAGHRYALVTLLQRRGHPNARTAVVCVHMITGWRHRRAVYAAGIVRLDTLLDRLTVHVGRVAVGGDWNRGWRSRAELPVRFTSRRPPAPTHSPGVVIDYWWWHGWVYRWQRVVGHTYSDHQGVRLRLAAH